MAEKLYKVNEAIELGYQAPNKETGLLGIVAEIYLPNKQKNSNFPDVEMVEVGATGTYRCEFTPDVQGTWQVIMHKADGDSQVTKSYSVGAFNVHTVGEAVVAVDSAVGGVDTKVTAVDGKVDTVNTNMAKDATVAKEATLTMLDGEIDTANAAITTVDGKVVTVDGKVVAVDNKCISIETKIDGIVTSVGSLDTPPMAF
jgi:uncharacterized protein YlzI (FlbEa/FlbD family)